MDCEPLLPGWAIALAAAVAFAALARTYRSGPGLLLRLGAIVLLVTMLLNPVRLTQQPSHVRPLVAVVVDSSLSMATDDCPGFPSRYAQALSAVAQLRARLADTHELHVHGLAGSILLPAPPVAPAGDTDFAPLTELLTSPRPQAVVLLSDGADWSDARPEESYIRAKVPLDTVVVGSTRSASNAAVRLAAESASALPGQEVALAAEVTASPDLRGRVVTLKVEAIDEQGAATTLTEQSVTLAAWTRIELTAPVGERRGGRLWRARIDHLPDEVTYLDNESLASTKVVDRDITVLVLEGEPGWDTTFAVRSWRRDRQFNVATLYALGSASWHAGGGTAVPTPLTAAALRGQDVVVLGARVQALVGSGGAAALAAFVDHGGGLLLLGPGPRALAAVDALDPCAWGPGLLTATLTSEGTTAGLLPPGAQVGVSAGAVTELRPQTRLLAGTRAQPLIALRRQGAGWVCSANLLGVWRWQLAPGSQGVEPAERLWRQLLHYLTNAPLGGLRPERTAVTVGEQLTLYVQPDLAEQAVTITDPAGHVTRQEPLKGALQLKIDQAGRWGFRLGADQVVVIASQFQREALEISRDDLRMRRLAERTGGIAGGYDDVARIAERLVASERLGGRVRTSTPMITEPAWFAALLLLLCGEWWWRRRRLGLV